jgi:1-acyl-sn-glycerol-3-phosphate acyltransferase
VPQDLFRSRRRASVSSGYWMFRGLVRLWISVFFRKMRTLAAEELPETSPALLLVSHRASFLDAVLLVAALDRQVHCLVDRNQMSGVWRRLLGQGLGMIPYEKESEGWRRAIETACNVLGNLGSVVVFTEPQMEERKESSLFARNAVTLAVEAESRNARQLGLMVVPVHLFLPVARLQASELLVYVDRKIPAHASTRAAENTEEWRRAVSAALEQACRENVFRLQPVDVSNFLSDLEELLLADLKEDFASRPGWKQKAEGFELSGFITEWAEQLNFLNPGRLVALRESLGEYREARRRSSQDQLEVETAGAWMQSAGRRGLAWAESVLGFPVALYGFVNHSLAALILLAGGLLKKRPEMDRTILWACRLAVILMCYAAQIFVCNEFLGRAAAGYYALSLPIAGVYLWRYSQLLRRRTRLLFLRASTARKTSKLHSMRKAFVDELNAARDIDATALEFSR